MRFEISRIGDARVEQADGSIRGNREGGKRGVRGSLKCVRPRASAIRCCEHRAVLSDDKTVCRIHERGGDDPGGQPRARRLRTPDRSAVCRPEHSPAVSDDPSEIRVCKLDFVQILRGRNDGIGPRVTAVDRLADSARLADDPTHIRGEEAHGVQRFGCVRIE